MSYFYRNWRDKTCRQVAWWLPKRIVLWAFIRVHVADGEGPGNEYKEKYDYWIKSNNMDEF